jgi:uncharacterized protein YjbJ (UPF0337 family)
MFMANEIKGKMKMAAGTVQKAYGKATDQSEHVAKGAARQVEGKVQESIGKLGDKLK